VDYPEDLEFASRVFEVLGSRPSAFSMNDVIQFLHIHPEIAAVNVMHAERGRALSARREARA
jgi:spore coat polysaccharide biosynthesis protein SpsF (cytidylyltransferase family)